MGTSEPSSSISREEAREQGSTQHDLLPMHLEVKHQHLLLRRHWRRQRLVPDEFSQSVLPCLLFGRLVHIATLLKVQCRQVVTWPIYTSPCGVGASRPATDSQGFSFAIYHAESWGPGPSVGLTINIMSTLDASSTAATCNTVHKSANSGTSQSHAGARKLFGTREEINLQNPNLKIGLTTRLERILENVLSGTEVDSSENKVSMCQGATLPDLGSDLERLEITNLSAFGAAATTTCKEIGAVAARNPHFDVKTEEDSKARGASDCHRCNKASVAAQMLTASAGLCVACKCKVSTPLEARAAPLDWFGSGGGSAAQS
ncbi:hypothetical protein FH972_025933 [Carpinus fangiana]|uniref:Uncharacterized protein n=1 Tax=Carpinus fangiana TaxID=176857 RepID=A0A5N6L3F9_9ROSI|nr:hypothetical protein FH972_025933 [Carpinus fangiana]